MHRPGSGLLNTHPTQAHMHGVEQFVYSGKTKYQDVEVIDTDFTADVWCWTEKYSLHNMMNIFTMKH